MATWCEELTHWKRPWCWKRLKAGGEGDDRGWDGWMASSTWWTWVWASFGSLWWTGKPDVLQSTGSQRVRHDWTTELNWNKLAFPLINILGFFFFLGGESGGHLVSLFCRAEIYSVLEAYLSKRKCIFNSCSVQVWFLGACTLKLFQSCLTLCDPMDCSPPGSSVHGTLRARTLEWVSTPSSKGPSLSTRWTQVA